MFEELFTIIIVNRSNKYRDDMDQSPYFLRTILLLNINGWLSELNELRNSITKKGHVSVASDLKICGQMENDKLLIIGLLFIKCELNHMKMN